MALMQLEYLLHPQFGDSIKNLNAYLSQLFNMNIFSSKFDQSGLFIPQECNRLHALLHTLWHSACARTEL